MSNKYFPPCRTTTNDIKVELDLSNSQQKMMLKI